MKDNKNEAVLKEVLKEFLYYENLCMQYRVLSIQSLKRIIEFLLEKSKEDEGGK